MRRLSAHANPTSILLTSAMSTLMMFMLACLVTLSQAADFRDGLLSVDGKPFFALTGWGGSPEELERLGLNTTFIGSVADESGLAARREQMRPYAAKGMQLIAYPGIRMGNATLAQHEEKVRTTAMLTTEPNLIGFFIGDDMSEIHLEAIKRTSTLLREYAPGRPIFADYIGEETAEAKEVFTRDIDIRCNYTYPVPGNPFRTYVEFFDTHREFVGDPLWTFLQCFGWESWSERLHLGVESDGPMPDAPQLRAMTYIALNRGLRGVIFFPFRVFARRPDLAAETAVVSREVKLVNDHLAAGEQTFNLVTSDTSVEASAMRYGRSTAVVAVVVGDNFHRWVDEGIVRNITIDVPWPDASTMSEVRAGIVQTPDVLPCEVSPGPTPGMLRVTVPSMEIGGMILLTPDSDEMDRLTQGAARIPDEVGTLMVLGGAAELEKSKHNLWAAGWDFLGAHMAPVSEAIDLMDRTATLTVERKNADAMRAWRGSQRIMRGLVDSLMLDLERRRPMLPEDQAVFLQIPHSIRMIDRLPRIPSPDDVWNYVRAFEVTGPFPLEWDGNYVSYGENGHGPAVAPGYDRVYPPEVGSAPTGPFATVDGPAGWQDAASDISGMLDLTQYFETTEDVVCYVRCTVIAPKDMETRMGVGTNDGGRIQLNGEEVYNMNTGRNVTSIVEMVPVRLRAGENQVLAKVSNLGGGWKLYLAFEDPDRELKYSVE
jgi:hypothetical protein